MKTVGQNIRDARKSANLTLKEISEQVDISISFLSDIERGRTLPSLKSLQKLANFYHRNVASFLVGVYIEEVPSPYHDFDNSHRESLAEIIMQNQVTIAPSKIELPNDDWMEIFVEIDKDHIARVLITQDGLGALIGA